MGPFKNSMNYMRTPTRVSIHINANKKGHTLAAYHINTATTSSVWGTSRAGPRNHIIIVIGPDCPAAGADCFLQHPFRSFFLLSALRYSLLVHIGNQTRASVSLDATRFKRFP